MSKIITTEQEVTDTLIVDNPTVDRQNEPNNEDTVTQRNLDKLSDLFNLIYS